MWDFGIINEGMILWVPFDPLNREGNSGMEPSKAEKIGLGKVSSTPDEMKNSQAQLLKDEAEVIKHTFGKDAFKKIAFTKERHDGTLDTVWVNTRTGKQITHNEAEKISISFYNKLFKENGFTDAEIESAFHIDKLNGRKNNVSKGRIQKLLKLYNDNINNSLVKLKELKTAGYVYHLSFGLPESNSNFHNFIIGVEYRNGKWVTLCGIEMAPPEQRNRGD